MYRIVLIDPDTGPKPDEFGTLHISAHPMRLGKNLSALLDWATLMMSKAGPDAVCDVYEERLFGKLSKRDGKLVNGCDTALCDLHGPQENPSTESVK
jgi:hypothetical protein